MARPYSLDLRERVVAAVEKGGMSRRRAAVQLGLGQHGHCVDAAFSSDGQCCARQDGWTQAEDDRRAHIAAGCCSGSSQPAARRYRHNRGDRRKASMAAQNLLELTPTAVSLHAPAELKAALVAERQGAHRLRI